MAVAQLEQAEMTADGVEGLVWFHGEAGGETGRERVGQAAHGAAQHRADDAGVLDRAGDAAHLKREAVLVDGAGDIDGHDQGDIDGRLGV